MIKLQNNQRMMSSQINAGSNFPSLLTILFIGLKLTGYIDWSWIWVLSPLWISGILVLVFLALMAANETN